MVEILVVDNYDSFVYTIVSYLQQLGAEVTVVRNDAVDPVNDVRRADGVLISPGPGNPQSAGRSLRVIEECASTATPMMGVCLGHQALGEFFGAVVTHAPQLRHGKTSPIAHDGSGVFDKLPNPMTATRYHSLVVDRSTVPSELLVNGWVEGDPSLVMGLRHETLPMHSVQFHPESVLTEGGYQLFATWLTIAGVTQAQAIVDRGLRVTDFDRYSGQGQQQSQ